MEASTYTTGAEIRHSIRPWSDFLSLSSLSFPIFSFPETSIRIQRNLYAYRGNYAIISLLVLFLSLIFHPISIIVFFITFLAWLFLYFFRDEPLLVLDYTIDDRLVLILLSVVTIAALGLTKVWWNVVVSGVIAGVFVCLHAALRTPDDVDDMESPYGALLSVVE